MYCGSIQINKPTTVSDLARVVKVYYTLKNSHGVNLDYFYSDVILSLERHLNSLAEHRGLNHYTALINSGSDYNPELLVTAIYVTEDRYCDPGRIDDTNDDLDSIVRSFLSIVGYNLHDAWVTYVDQLAKQQMTDDDRTEIAWLSFNIGQLKLEWENAHLQTQQRALRNKYFENTGKYHFQD